MKSPFKNTTPAFDVFFDDIIVSIVKNENGCKLHTTLKCCIMDDITSDGILDESIDTNQKNFNILIDKGDMTSLKIKRGDKLFSSSGKKYYVMSIQDDDVFSGVMIKARLG